MTATLTVTTDADGRITGACVPEGTALQIVPDVPPSVAYAARYGTEGERFFYYDPDRDVGSTFARGYRRRAGFTVHDIEGRGR